MGRPVVFRQTRAGAGGKPFTLLKLRSMSEQRDSAGELLSDSERTTPVGRFLRRSRLDELPGLLNVVWGDMNFVGPRPLLPETIKMKGEAGRARGAVRPGVTGWAQVNGRDELSIPDKVAFDVEYLERQSFWFDLKILWMTLLKVIKRDNVSH